MKSKRVIKFNKPIKIDRSINFFFYQDIRSHRTLGYRHRTNKMKNSERKSRKEAIGGVILKK